MEKDIQIDRKISYDERRKILTIEASVKTKKRDQHSKSIFDGEEMIKEAFKYPVQKKESSQKQIEIFEKNIEAVKDKMKDIPASDRTLNEEEEKIKKVLDKIGKSMAYDQLVADKKEHEKSLKISKEDLKESNMFITELKQKIKNIKLE